MSFGMTVYSQSGDAVISQTTKLARLIKTVTLPANSSGTISVPGVYAGKSAYFYHSAVPTGKARHSVSIGDGVVTFTDVNGSPEEQVSFVTFA